MEMYYLTPYLTELVAVTSVAVFMALIPGVDFVMVTRTSMSEGRIAGFYTTLGICLSICMHATYTLAGLAVIIANSVWLFSMIQYLGAAYLIYMGWQLLKNNQEVNMNLENGSKPVTSLSALRSGFMTNMLNPKAPLFFLSIFTQVVAIDTPFSMQIIYASIIVFAHFIWFSAVTLLLSHPSLLPRFNRYKHTIDKLAGIVLVAFAIKIII